MTDLVPEDAEDFVLDLDAQRAARREAAGKPLRIKLNGTIHELPFEVPLDFLAPLENIDLDLALLIRIAMDANEGKPNANRDATNIVIDMLMTNPALPKEVLAAARAMARNLLGEAAYSDLVAMRPSREDLAALANWLFEKYGVSLGESLGSNESSGDDGGTSKPTSNASTDSTPEVSTATPATLDSSASAA